MQKSRSFGVWLCILPLLASSVSWASMFDIQFWNGSTPRGDWAAPIIDTGHASRLVGQQRLDHAPFEVGQVISAHFELESEFGTI